METPPIMPIPDRRNTNKPSVIYLEEKRKQDEENRRTIKSDRRITNDSDIPITNDRRITTIDRRSVHTPEIPSLVEDLRRKIVSQEKTNEWAPIAIPLATKQALFILEEKLHGYNLNPTTGNLSLVEITENENKEKVIHFKYNDKKFKVEIEVTPKIEQKTATAEIKSFIQLRSESKKIITSSSPFKKLETTTPEENTNNIPPAIQKKDIPTKNNGLDKFTIY